MRITAMRFAGWTLAVLGTAFSTGCRAQETPPADEGTVKDMSPSQVVGIGRIEPELGNEELARMADRQMKMVDGKFVEK